MERNTWKGRVYAVTGASSGIGLAIVEKLLTLEAKVALADIDPCPEHLNGHTSLMYTKVDVSSREQVREWVSTIIGKFGRLDGMCANAGISPWEGGMISDELYHRVMSVCLDGVWHCGTEAIKQFLQQGGGGVIVNTASAAGLRSTKGLAAYSAAKHGVVGLTKAWAIEYAKNGIRVNALAPGLTSSKMQRETFSLFADSSDVQAIAASTPMGRMGQPHELADSVVFLLGDCATFVTGHILSCDGGTIAA